MRKVRFNLKKECFEEMIEAGRLNPSLEIIFRDKTGSHTHKIGAGYSDDIFVYRESEDTFVLSRSENLGYASLEVFTGNEKTGDIFIDSHQVEDTIGNSDRAPYTIIRRLMPYME